MYLSRFNDLPRTTIDTVRQPSIARHPLLSYQNIGPIAGTIDAFLVFISYLILLVGYTYLYDKTLIDKQHVVSIAAANSVIFYYIAKNRGLYRPPVLLARSRYTRRILEIWTIACFPISLAFFLIEDKTELYFEYIFYSILIQLFILLAAHFIIEKILRPIMVGQGGAGRPVVTLGEPTELIGLSRAFLARYFGLREVSRISIGANHASSSDGVRANVNRALNEARERGAEEFVIALRWTSSVLLESVRDQLRASPLPVRLLPDSTMRSVLGRDALLNGRPSLAVKLQREPISASERALKRALDILLAATAIIILSPILVCAAVAVKLDSPGPVLFRQRRNGFNANQFVILKFRTMTVLEDGPTVTQVCRGDHRVTRVGRFLRRSSLDELPQLINVIMGDMSLVGPRPHALAHDHEYQSLIAEYAFRHHVKPGITGWAQVNGLRGETKRLEQMVERVKLDLWYIGHWSFWLDIKIIVRTCFEVLRSHAY
jgi:Undecaprenyl-phosphate glucose phosphotransferase